MLKSPHNIHMYVHGKCKQRNANMIAGSKNRCLIILTLPFMVIHPVAICISGVCMLPFGSCLLSALDMPSHELSASEFQSVFVVADESH